MLLQQAKLIQKMKKIPNYVIEVVWRDVVPHFERGKEHWEDFYDLEDIFNLLVEGKQQLWCFYKGREVIGVVLTQLDVFPKCVSLRFMYLGGEGFEEQQLVWLEMIEDWGMQNEAVLVDFLGRKGWGRFLKKYGYVETGMVYRKRLEKKELANV